MNGPAALFPLSFPLFTLFLVREFLFFLHLLRYPLHGLPRYHNVRQIAVPLLKLDSFLCGFQVGLETGM